MNTQVKNPEFIEFNLPLMDSVFALLQNYPYKEVAAILETLRKSTIDEERKVFKVPYATADACYLLLSKDQAVLTVRGIEKSAEEALKKMKIEPAKATKNDKPEVPGTEADIPAESKPSKEQNDKEEV